MCREEELSREMADGQVGTAKITSEPLELLEAAAAFWGQLTIACRGPDANCCEEHDPCEALGWFGCCEVEKANCTWFS